MRTEILSFKKSNGKKIAGKAFVPDKEGCYPAVIFAHGFGGNYRQLEHHGQGFADEEIVCIFFDFCGGGVESLSDGKLIEMTPMTEIEDLEFVVNEAGKLSYVDGERLFLQGESMGGFVAAYLAAKMSEKIKGLVLWYPAFVIPDDSKRRFENGENSVFGMEICPNYNKVAMEIDIFKEISGYQGPVQIIHGDADPIVPLSYSNKAAKVYENVKLLVIPKAGHGFEGTDSQMVRESSIAFIKSLL